MSLEWVEAPFGCVTTLLDDAELMIFNDGRWAVRLLVVPDTPERLRKYVTRANGRESSVDDAKKRVMNVYASLTRELSCDHERAWIIDRPKDSPASWCPRCGAFKVDREQPWRMLGWPFA